MIDTTQLPDVAPDYDLRELLEAGCHFGHKASHWHPQMQDWIYMTKDGTHIFDLEKTARQLQAAYNYLHQLGKQGKSVVFVGTKRQAREILEEKARTAGVLWITSRWLGGLLTNWEQVSKSLRKMIEIEEGLAGGKYEMYTKYEQVQLEKEASRFARFFDGLRPLTKLPDALVIIDPGKEQIALKEANLTGVPVVAVVDTDTDPAGVELVVPANDDGRSSLELIVTQLLEAYTQGKAASGQAKSPAKTTQAKPVKAETTRATKTTKTVKTAKTAKTKAAPTAAKTSTKTSVKTKTSSKVKSKVSKKVDTKVKKEVKTKVKAKTD